MHETSWLLLSFLDGSRFLFKQQKSKLNLIILREEAEDFFNLISPRVFMSVWGVSTLKSHERHPSLLEHSQFIRNEEMKKWRKTGSLIKRETRLAKWKPQSTENLFQKEKFGLRNYIISCMISASFFFLIIIPSVILISIREERELETFHLCSSEKEEVSIQKRHCTQEVVVFSWFVA